MDEGKTSDQTRTLSADEREAIKREFWRRSNNWTVPLNEVIADMVLAARRDGDHRVEEAKAEGMDKGASEAIEMLACYLAVFQWEGGDGTESWYGDVGVEIKNVLKEARVYDEEDGRIARLDDADRRVEGAFRAGYDAAHRDWAASQLGEAVQGINLRYAEYLANQEPPRELFSL